MLFFYSCKSTRNLPQELNPVYVTNTKKINLLPKESMTDSIDTVMLFNGRYGKTSFSALAYIQCDSNGLFLSLLNDFGTDMGNVIYDGSSVSFESAYFPSNMKAEYIVSDIQLAFYNVDDVAENLKSAGLGFEYEKLDDGTEIRKILNGSKLIEKISINGSSIQIKNFLRNYEYNLKAAEE